MRWLALAGSALLAGCGPADEPTLEPLGRGNDAASDDLLNEAARAAGNAQGRMSAEAGSEPSSNLQGELNP